MEEVPSVLIIGGEHTEFRCSQTYIQNIGYKVASIAFNLQQALQTLPVLEYDLVLLDLDIGDKPLGFELDKIIQLAYYKPVLFVTPTIYSATAHKVPPDCNSHKFSKPINGFPPFFALQNAQENGNGKKGQFVPEAAKEQKLFFFVKQGTSYKKIEWTDVIYLGVEQNYTRVFTQKDKTGYLIRYTLHKAWEDIIPDCLKKDFIRVNRSEIVQVRYIEEIKEGMLITMLKPFNITKSFWAKIKDKLHLIS